MTRLWDAYSYLRKHIGIILIGGAALSVAGTASSYVLYVMVFWAAIAAWLTISAYRKTREISKKFGGRLLEFVFAPTPMGSLIQSLAKHGIAPENIKSVELMSADIKESLHYFERGDADGTCSFVDMLKRCPEMKVTVYGQCSKKIDAYPGIAIVRTRDRYVEHTNLLTTKDGKNFVWFEPYHNVVDGRHYFGRGAYLFEVTRDIADVVQRDLKNLPRLESA